MGLVVATHCDVCKRQDMVEKARKGGRQFASSVFYLLGWWCRSGCLWGRWWWVYEERTGRRRVPFSLGSGVLPI